MTQEQAQHKTQQAANSKQRGMSSAMLIRHEQEKVSKR